MIIKIYDLTIVEIKKIKNQWQVKHGLYYFENISIFIVFKSWILLNLIQNFPDIIHTCGTRCCCLLSQLPVFKISMLRALTFNSYEYINEG